MLAKIAALHVVCVGRGPHRDPGRAASHECFAPMCELLHTASANQTCDGTILLWEQAPLVLNAQRPPITGVPGAQIGGPLSGGTRLRSQGRVVRRPPRFRTIHVRPKDLPVLPRQPQRAVSWLNGVPVGAGVPAAQQAKPQPRRRRSYSSSEPTRSEFGGNPHPPE